MGNNGVRKGQLMNVLFTMLLFLVFVLCALFTVLIGGRVYENINSRTEDNFAGCTAIHYVANKVRQGDKDGLIDCIDVDGTSVLELKQVNGQDTYVTWIYCYDGSIRELFTYEGSGLGLSDGLPIMECGGLVAEKTGSLLTVTTQGKGGSTIMLSVRSGGNL